MTTTHETPRAAFPLVEEVRAMRTVPTCQQRKAVRVRARLSQGRIAHEVGLSAQRIWQFENVIEDLPLTSKVLRYLDLIAQLDEATRPANAVQK
jgi:DNA-binding XRE family transcriptional regulator